mmetsp:Transcript_4546/g.11702  ORF Transcript_4546/g.11702 Transcript_4546/m.11702 type:complete len:242 (+) Transcript_4546:158-883(+)
MACAALGCACISILGILAVRRGAAATDMNTTTSSSAGSDPLSLWMSSPVMSLRPAQDGEKLGRQERRPSAASRGPARTELGALKGDLLPLAKHEAGGAGGGQQRQPDGRVGALARGLGAAPGAHVRLAPAGAAHVDHDARGRQLRGQQPRVHALQKLGHAVHAVGPAVLRVRAVRDGALKLRGQRLQLRVAAGILKRLAQLCVLHGPQRAGPAAHVDDPAARVDQLLQTLAHCDCAAVVGV